MILLKLGFGIDMFDDVAGSTAEICPIKPARQVPAMSMLSSAARKRILSDLKHLQEEPIPLAAAAPADDDLSLWNGIIGTQMEAWSGGIQCFFLMFFSQYFSERHTVVAVLLV